MSEATSLPNEKRAENYIRQNMKHRHTPKLSSRQKRRLTKHDNKRLANLKKINNVKAASFKDEVSETLDILNDVETMSAIAEAELAPEGEHGDRVVEAIVRPCGGTDHCITPKGAKAAKTHKKCAA